MCASCLVQLTVEHLLIQCFSHAIIRKRYFHCCSLEDLFNSIGCHATLSYLLSYFLFTAVFKYSNIINCYLLYQHHFLNVIVVFFGLMAFVC